MCKDLFVTFFLAHGTSYYCCFYMEPFPWWLYIYIVKIIHPIIGDMDG